MKTKLWGLIMVMTMLALPLIALAQVATPTPLPPEDMGAALETIPKIIGAISEGNWSMVAALSLMVLVWAMRRYNAQIREKIPTKAVPWLSLAIAFLLYVGPALYIGMPAAQAIFQGLTIGVSGVGFWELIGKHFFAKPAVEK